MEILLGGVSSLLYGVADFLGGEGAKKAPAPAIVLWSATISFPVLAGAALIVGGGAVPSDYLWGALAGAGGALGLVLLFAGLSRARAAVVAPVAAATSAVLPVVVGVAGGERHSALVWLGVAIAIPSIALCSWTASGNGGQRGGLLYGLGAGLGFGAFTVVIDLTGAESNLLPLIASRGATLAVVGLLAVLGVWRVVGVSAVPLGIVVANAFLDTAANVTLLLALRAGSLALAAVAASFYPAVTVMMARFVNHEHLLRRQVSGLVLTLVALSAIALG